MEETLTLTSTSTTGLLKRSVGVGCVRACDWRGRDGGTETDWREGASEGARADAMHIGGGSFPNFERTPIIITKPHHHMPAVWPALTPMAESQRQIHHHHHRGTSASAAAMLR